MHSRERRRVRKRRPPQIGFAPPARPARRYHGRPCATCSSTKWRSMRGWPSSGRSPRSRASATCRSARCRARLSRLEKACGARLMHRSTHGLSLTDEGRTFLDYSRRAPAPWRNSKANSPPRRRAERPRARGRQHGRRAVPARAQPAGPGAAPSAPAGRAGGRRPPARHGARRHRHRHPHRQRPARHRGRAPDRHPGARALCRARLRALARPARSTRTNCAAHSADHQQRRRPLLNEWPFLVDGEPLDVRRAGPMARQRHQHGGDHGAAGPGHRPAGDAGGRSRWCSRDCWCRCCRSSSTCGRCRCYAVTAGTRHRLPKIKACLDYWTEWFGRGA